MESGLAIPPFQLLLSLPLWLKWRRFKEWVACPLISYSSRVGLLLQCIVGRGSYQCPIKWLAAWWQIPVGIIQLEWRCPIVAFPPNGWPASWVAVQGAEAFTAPGDLLCVSWWRHLCNGDLHLITGLDLLIPRNNKADLSVARQNNLSCCFNLQRNLTQNSL